MTCATLGFHRAALKGPRKGARGARYVEPMDDELMETALIRQGVMSVRNGKGQVAVMEAPGANLTKDGQGETPRSAVCDAAITARVVRFSKAATRGEDCSREYAKCQHVEPNRDRRLGV